MLGVGLLGGLGRVVIANVGVEGGDQHEGVVQVVAALLPVAVMPTAQWSLKERMQSVSSRADWGKL